MNIKYILKNRLETGSVQIDSMIDRIDYLHKKLDAQMSCEFLQKGSDNFKILEHKSDCKKCEIFKPFNKWLIEGDAK